MKVLIVGAGIYGLTCALQLAREGVEIEILDRGSIPCKASSSYDHHRLIRHAYGPQQGYANLIPEAFLAWERIWEVIECNEYMETGCLVLGRSTDSWLSDSLDSLDKLHVSYERWNAENVNAFLPWVRMRAVDNVIYTPSGGILRASRILEALVLTLKSLGATFRPGVEIGSVNVDQASVTALNQHVYTADYVVCALGAHHPDLFPGEITSYRQVHAQFDFVPKVASAEFGCPMILDISGDAGFYYVPGSSAFPAKIGDHVSRFEGAPKNGLPISDAEKANLKAVILSRTDAFWSKRPSRWALCHYACTSDRTIRFRSTPVFSTIYGGSGHGFKFGALFGEYIAGVVLGRLSANEVAALISGTSEVSRLPQWPQSPSVS